MTSRSIVLPTVQYKHTAYGHSNISKRKTKKSERRDMLQVAPPQKLISSGKRRARNELGKDD